MSVEYNWTKMYDCKVRQYCEYKIPGRTSNENLTIHGLEFSPHSSCDYIQSLWSENSDIRTIFHWLSETN